MLVIIFINFKSHKVYYFKMPIASKVVSISLEKDKKNKLFSDNKEIKKIYNYFNDNIKTLINHTSSKQVSGIIKITFYYEESIATVIYLYKFDDEYYLEQLNNGVYVIDKDLYDKVNNYVI